MSRPDPHIIGLCPSTSYLLQMYIKSRMNKQPEKKTTVFTKKICKFKTSYYLCNTKFQRWIHLRVRIRASHARHRGSNPLSTTKSDCNSRSFYYCLSRVTGQGKFGQTEQRGPDELRSSRRVVTFEDKRSQSAIQSDRQRDLFLFCTPRLRHKSRNPIRAGCATEQCENRLSRRKTTAPDKGKNDPSRPPPALPVENSSEPKTARNPNSENHKFKITGLHRQYFSSNRYLCKRIKYIIYFSHAHRFGHCSQLLSCSLSRAAYRKYSATNVSGLRTDSAR